MSQSVRLSVSQSVSQSVNQSFSHQQFVRFDDGGSKEFQIPFLTQLLQRTVNVVVYVTVGHRDNDRIHTLTTLLHQLDHVICDKSIVRIRLRLSVHTCNYTYM